MGTESDSSRRQPKGDKRDRTRAKLLEEHHARTGSPKAAELLANWSQAQTRFVKVVPTEYRRVLAEQAKRERSAPSLGLPVVQPGAE